mmetsp:Transcript_42558/g.129129  ORF Transcript_42558/g.129129 Transcript_42558/m.129129 type:complete len:209 (-) Transcript_42558:236-862(-)
MNVEFLRFVLAYHVQFDPVKVGRVDAANRRIEGQIGHHLNEPPAVSDADPSGEDVARPPLQIQFSPYASVGDAADHAVGHAPPFGPAGRRRERLGQIVDRARGRAFHVGRLGLAHLSRRSRGSGLAIYGRLTSRGTLVGSHGVDEILVGRPADASDLPQECHGVVVLLSGFGSGHGRGGIRGGFIFGTFELRGERLEDIVGYTLFVRV